ncbi:MAG: ATP-dependent DNA helicase UvrD2 [Candidatus Nanopelagicales bacterium]
MTLTHLPADPAELLSGLDPEQQAVAESISGPVVVMAGAGTGKTRAITHRIAYAVAMGRHDPAKTLAVTFTNRAAGEMSRRLAGLGVAGVRVRTFHSAALRQLRWAWPQAIGGEMHDVIASKSSLVASAASQLRLGSDFATVRDLATEIEWAKVMQVGPAEYAGVASLHGRKGPGGLTVEQAGEVYEGYERLKRSAGRIDFEDVLLLTVGVLEDRQDLRQQVQNSFAHFTVDEFQDVSAVQQRLLQVWLGDRDDVCVVGDVAQTIYSFAGADPSHLLHFGNQFANTTVVSLARCYRCTPQIVQVAEDVLADGVVSAQLLATTKARRVPLRSQVGDGPAPRVVQYADEPSEAVAVVSQIRKLIAAGTPPREIAILVRINALTEQFEAALADAGIAYSVRGGRRFFDRPEVRKGVSLLRGAARGAADIGQAPDDPITLFRAILSAAGWSEKPPTGTGAVREAWESLAALVGLCDEVVAADSSAGLNEIIREIARREEVQDAPSVDGVTLASLHAAKGMEWDAVFLVGLVDTMVPMSHAETPAQVEEERRLLYVGITRARAFLQLSWADSRLPGGRPRKPSRFLAPIPGHAGSDRNRKAESISAVKRRARKPANCRICGKALVTAKERSVIRCRTCPSQVNEQLLDALQQWRTETVATLAAERGSSIPAYVVATDATLEALAEQVPTDSAELAAIPGLGPAKLAAYGQALMTLLDQHR